MWRESGDGSRARGQTAGTGTDRFSLAVVGALLCGALLAAGWSVSRRQIGDVSASAGSAVSPGHGWSVEAGRQWERWLVRITTDRCDDSVQGTGVVVGGRIWTNRHVIAGGRRVRVTFADGRIAEVAGAEIAGDVDLAALDVDGLPDGLVWSADGLGASSSSTLVPEGLTVAGFPGGRSLSVRSATVVGTRSGWGDRDPAQPRVLDVVARPGESGSPVVAADGSVAALVYARDEPDGAALVIAADDVRSAAATMTPMVAPRC